MDYRSYQTCAVGLKGLLGVPSTKTSGLDHVTSKHDTPNSTYKVTPYKDKSVIYGGLQGAKFYTRCMILSGVYFWTTLYVTCIDYTFVTLQSPIDLPGEADVTPVHSSVNNVSADSVIVTSSDRIRHDYVTLMTCTERLQPSRYLRLFQENYPGPKERNVIRTM